MSIFDLVDEHDNPTGRTASYDEVHAKGLWHHGVHAIIYTPDSQIVMQKRAVSLKYHPGEIEISVGGGVDAGETPEQAVIREIREELGISVKPTELRYLGKEKFNHRTATQIMRVFNYSFAVCLAPERLHFQADSDEVERVFMISKRKLYAALRRHRIKHIGRITSTYAYWRHLLDAI